MAREGLGLLFEMPHEQLDHPGERHLATAQHSLLLDQRRAEDGLQRAHQPPLGLADIGRDRRVAEQREAALAADRRFVVEEHGARHQGAGAFERGEGRDAVPAHADRGVRRAEIDAASV